MKVHVLKVPYDSGHRCERMARGPGYLLSKGAVSGDTVEAIETDAFGEVGAAFDLARQLSLRVSAIRDAGDLPVVLSGNCNSAMGTVAGLGSDKTGVLWFDAHGEFNTPETSASGFFDGMPLAVMTGRCWKALAKSIPQFAPVPEEHIVLAGVRDTNGEEQAALDASRIMQVRRPFEIHEALVEVARYVDHWYMHLDLDVLDPREATTNPWVPPDGLKASDVATAIRNAAQLRPIAAIAVASLDPACDGDGRAVAAVWELLGTAVAAAGG